MIKITPEQAFYFTNKLAFHLMSHSDESKDHEYVRGKIKKKNPWFSETMEKLVISALESDSVYLFNLATMSVSDQDKVSLLMDMSKITVQEVGVAFSSSKLTEFYSDCQIDMSLEHWEIENILFDLMRVTKVRRGILT